MSDDNSTRNESAMWKLCIISALIAIVMYLSAINGQIRDFREETRYARPMPTLDYTGGATEEGISDEWK